MIKKLDNKVNYIKILLAIFLIAGLHSCASYKKHLPEGETLYVGSKLKVKDSVIKERKALETELKEALRPKPNKKIFGLRFKLGVYNTVGEPKSSKGLRSYIREKIGEAPVLGSSFNLKRNEQILTNILHNNGYFKSEIIANRIVDSASKTTKGEFEIIAGNRRYFDSVYYVEGDTSELAKDILSIRKESFIKKGNPYFLQAIIDERERIDNDLKNKGYFYFSPDFLIAKVDTGLNSDSVSVHLSLKYEVLDPKVFKVYHIKDVVINPRYLLRNNNSLSEDTSSESSSRTFISYYDTVFYKDYKFLYRGKPNFKPNLFIRAIHLKPGDIYSRKDQNVSLNRLVSLNAFKFIKNEMVESFDSSGRALLTANYLLTPYDSKILNSDLSVFSQNDSRVGSRISVGWKHRNILRGAEQLEIKLSGGFEVQYGGQYKVPNLYNFGAETGLTVPRLLFLNSLGITTNSNYIPKTNMNLNYNFYNRTTAYKLNALNFSFGYIWKESIKKDHKLYPLNLTFVRTDTIKNSPNFDLSNVIFNGIIIGPTYQFSYNSSVNKNSSNKFLFDGLIDLSGNITGLIQGSSLNKEPQKILGAQYAQYIKMQTDYRYLKRINSNFTWANRLFVGVGYPYGNSHNLPNIKQFFVGGASSLRGFRSRLLGPGSYSIEDAMNSKYLELLGDIKLEANTEFRFPIYSTWLKGAVFLDAGNIWLWRQDSAMPKGNFTKNFYDDIALNTGLGFRFDFSIIVLRTDFGIPLRNPGFPDDKKWLFNQVDFTSKAWRKQNIIFNLAIGYPF
ncbi:MAG TPA: BamA/TamA family outer membrane protein [Edaphocola sp.]|nr:BamA/TamA family outer membrane protein [Edaphocola sp.]